jgi:hypothetical protein
MVYSTFILVCVALLSVASAFVPASRAASSTKIFGEKSIAVPFLEKPAGLDGTLVGDYGFDPLKFTDTIGNINYVAAAELKHGRVSMLACLGFITQQYIHFRIDEPNPFAAASALGYGPNLQILSFIGVIELATWDKTFKGAAPGNYGFDPLKFLTGKTDKQKNEMALKEIKNGRLAMIGIMGLMAQNLATGGANTF